MKTLSAAFFAASHDGGVQSIAKVLRHLVNLVGAVDLDRLASRVEDDLAVAALLEVLFDFGTGLRRNGVVDQFVEDGEKLSAGHDAASATEGIGMGKKWFMAVVRLGLILRASFLLRPAFWTPLSF